MTAFTKSKILFISCILGLLMADLWYQIDWYFYLIPLGLFLVFIAISTTTLRLNVFMPSYSQPSVESPQVALTLDDGPDENTINVLASLKQHNAKATFFCVGHKIEKYPEIMKSIVDAGHSIGNHSYSHSNFFPLFSKKQISLEIQKTSSFIESYTNKPCRLFRPPFGVINPNVAAAVKNTNHKIIGWNLRTFDTTRNYKKVIKQLKKKLRPGSVVLLHDDRTNTAEVLDEILLYGKSKGFTFVTVEEIFEIKK